MPDSGRGGGRGEKTIALQAMKGAGEKIAVLTCYDYPTAVWQEEAGVDVIFVADSGTNRRYCNHSTNYAVDNVNPKASILSLALLKNDVPLRSRPTGAKVIRRPLDRSPNRDSVEE